MPCSTPGAGSDPIKIIALPLNHHERRNYHMPKYKVSYSGFVYIEAEDAEAAEECYDFGGIYEEKEVTAVEEVDAFTVTLTDDIW